MSQADEKQGETLCREIARGRAVFGVESMGDEVQSAAEWWQDELGKVLNATAKQIRICVRSMGWSNGRNKEKSSQLGREKRRRRPPVATAQAKAKLRKSIPRAKGRMWNDFLKSLRGAELWKAAKVANPRAGATVEALTDRHGKQANTITKKKEMVTLESFPPNEYD
jgi:hypothetical protein